MQTPGVQGAPFVNVLGLDNSGAAHDYYIDPMNVTGNARDSYPHGTLKSAPLLSLAGFYALYPYELRNGSVAVIHLAGAASTTGDPWDAPTGTTVQDYPIDIVDLGGGEVLGNNVALHGPQMIVATLATGLGTRPAGAGGWTLAAATIAEACTAAGVADPLGRFTRIDPNTGLAGWVNWTAHDMQGRGCFVRLKRAANMRVYELPIHDNTTTGVIVPCLGLVGNLLATDTLEIVVPGARIRGTASAAASRYVSIQGQGCMTPVVAASTDTGHTFERLTIDRCYNRGEGVSFDRCLFTDAGTGANALLNRGEAGLVNCKATGIVTWEGDHMGAGLPGARPDSATSPALLTPLVDAVVNAGMVLGTVARPGKYVGVRNLCIDNSATDGLSVYGHGSQFTQVGDLLGAANTGVGLRAQRGGCAAVLGGVNNEITGAGGDLQLEGGAAVAYGTGIGGFEEAAGLNGNLHTTQVTAGPVPLGLFSQIAI